MPNYFEILGIKPTLDMEQVKAGFIRKIVSFHPDIVGIDLAKRDEVFDACIHLQNPIKLKECYEASSLATNGNSVADSNSSLLVADREAKNDLPSDPQLAVYIANLPYTRQVIIDLLSSKDRDYSQPLKDKWDRHSSYPCEIIKPKKYSEQKIDISEYQSDDFVRIYVLAVKRGKPPRSLCIGEDNFSYDDLAKYILPLINKLRCVVNLVVPKAGSGNPSFAAGLHEYLFSKTNKDVPVIARTLSLSLPYAFPNQGKMTKKDDHRSYSHQLPGSKIILTIDAAGNQIQLDAYAYRWKKSFFNKLKQIKSETENSHSKGLLTGWLNIMVNMTPQDIISLMRCEINNSTSILKEQSISIDSFFSNPTLGSFFSNSTFNRVSNLLNELKESGDANKTPMITKTGMVNRR
ncbi:MAG: J domain-containing protein [Pseudomonadota bacterium]